ncbi:MAG TPA: lysylphosphatidylglycerol synthase domain-containing protein [Solirubrobacteraceae bacterium]|jgi:uncharacterized membrane protein YbhN (UPF0104 family)
MSRTAWAWSRFVASGVILGVLVWRLGTGPFLDGVRTVDAQALVAAAVLAVPTTLCCAWRWKIVARGFGVDLPLPAAVAAYYRSLFLNVTLPGGVVGDVHRGVSHGREVSAVGRALRAVAWERFVGQVVQVVLTVAVLLALPSPVHSSMPLLASGLGAAAALALLLARVRRGAERSAWGRVRGAVAGDVRKVLGRKAWLGISVTSAVVVGGHAATFLIAARTAGSTAPLSRLLPLTLLVLAVMVVPSVGGWGPREGAAAWAFGAAGLSAGQGVATAVVYGVMVLVACLPGAVVLLVSWSRRMRSPKRTQHKRSPGRRQRPLVEGAAHA